MEPDRAHYYIINPKFPGYGSAWMYQNSTSVFLRWVLITSCPLGVVSQRLVRKICSNCKREYVPSEELLKEFFDTIPSDIQWYRGQKCSVCDYTGYNGRVAVAQIWTPNENDIILINKGTSIDELRQSSYQSTLLMVEDAMRLLKNGTTNLEELMRTLPYSNIYESRKILQSRNLH